MVLLINDAVDSHLTHCLLVSSPSSCSLSQRQQCGLISSGPRVEGSPAPGSSWTLELKDSSLLVSPSCAKCIYKQAFSVAPCSYSQGVKRERLESRQSMAWRIEPGKAWSERWSLGVARPALLALCPELWMGSPLPGLLPYASCWDPKRHGACVTLL